MTKSRTLKDHVEFAANFKRLENELIDVLLPMMNKYRKDDKVHQLIEKICPGIPNNIWLELKSELDKDYHSIASDEDFKELGNVYYKK